VECTYTRARELCQQVGETPQLFPVLAGLRLFYTLRGELRTARELGDQLLRLAQKEQDLTYLLEAHYALAEALFLQGEVALAREHAEQAVALYDPQQHHALTFLYGEDPGVVCLVWMAWTFWLLGYPDQALNKIRDTLSLIRGLAHPYSLAYALSHTAVIHQFRREGHAAQEWAEAAMALAADHGFPFFSALGAILRGWALAEQGWGEEGIAQIQQGLNIWQAVAGEAGFSVWLVLLAEAHGQTGHPEEGLTVLAELQATMDRTGEGVYKAELYRLRGELLLTQEIKSQGAKGKSQKSKMTDLRPLTPDPQAEECFQQAIEVARSQGAKSLELRAVMSLARLWQQQGKHYEARDMLSEIYHWFSEGFDTKDLKEAKTLIEELAIEPLKN
jgi:predicted ATPase